MALTAKTLIACGVPAEVARAHVPHMARAMRAHGLTTRPRARAFLATVLHESMGLRRMSEIGGGAKYEGRRDLGNTHRGDGERFKGRGPIQLTGRGNYAAYGRTLGLDLVGHPELVATPKVGWQVAACYFKQRAGVLAAADAGDFRRVTKQVNGGYNGWDDRLRYWNRLAKLGVVPEAPHGHDGAGPAARPPREHDGGRPAHGKPAHGKPAHGKPAKPGTAGASGPAVLDRVPKPGRPAPAARPGGDARAAQLWRRLERLDRESDRVRAGLRTAMPIVTGAEGLTDAQLVKALERVDEQSDVLRKALVTRVATPPRAPTAHELLLALARELQAVSAQLSDVAEGHAATPAPPTAAPPTAAPQPAAPPTAAPQPAAPQPPAPPTAAPQPAAPQPAAPQPAAPQPPAPPTAAPQPPAPPAAAPQPAAQEPAAAVAELEALEARSDLLREQLEAALLARAGEPASPARAETSRYLERLARLDALDAESDRIRGALRPVRAGRAPRAFRVRRPELRGEDVRSWQRHLNRCLRAWHVDHDVAVDGEYGPETARWTRRVLYGIGIAQGDGQPLTPEARVKARHPDRRTPAERAAARARRAWRERLARHHAAPKGGKRAALAYARKHADRRTAETRTNGGPFIDDWCRMVHLTPGTAGAHWCGAFVNACLVEAGLPSRDWLRYTPSIVNNARSGHEGWSWHTRPRVGDLVLFDWPGGDFVDHVGIVVEVRAGGAVRTVEGNFQDRVGYWDRKSQILGYARPPWR